MQYTKEKQEMRHTRLRIVVTVGGGGGCDWRLLTNRFKGSGNIFKTGDIHANVHFLFFKLYMYKLHPRNSERF